MQIKINQLREDVEDLDNQVDVLKNQINRMLESERREIERGEQQH